MSIAQPKTLGKHWGWCSFAVAVLLAMVLLGQLGRPAEAQAQLGPIVDIPGVPNPCSAIPNAAARRICNAARNPSGAAGDAIGAIPGVPNPTQAIGGLVGGGIDALIREIALMEAQAVQSALRRQVQFIQSSTVPDTNAAWFKTMYALIFGMSVYLAISMFGFRMLGAMKKEDAGELLGGSAALVFYMAAVGLLPYLVFTFTRFADEEIAGALLNSSDAVGGRTIERLITTMTKDINSLGDASVSILIPVIILFVGLFAGALIEIMLLVREALLIFFTALLPVVLALRVGGKVGDAAVKRVGLGLLALVIFKDVMALTLLIGVNLVAVGSEAEPLFMGVVVLIMVLVTPWWVYHQLSNHNFNAQERTMKVIAYANLARRR